jgi:site-specific DNA-cytosine methylase
MGSTLTAGLHIKWRFDQPLNAMAIYPLNFATAECELCDVFSFLTNLLESLKVDVSHGSPPCQIFLRPILSPVWMMMLIRRASFPVRI